MKLIEMVCLLAYSTSGNCSATSFHVVHVIERPATRLPSTASTKLGGPLQMSPRVRREMYCSEPATIVVAVRLLESVSIEPPYALASGVLAAPVAGRVIASPSIVILLTEAV